MAPFSLPCSFIFLSLFSFLQHIVSDTEFVSDRGTCDVPFLLDKHTVATSDSLRDCESALRIFPEIQQEETSKFHDGECAYQCKLELPFSCFKLHAPQTQYDEGLLQIETLEQIVSDKWRSVMNGKLKYDPFFDYNIAFWVQSLDDYITYWKSQEPIIELEYFGIRWKLPSELSTNLVIDDDSTYSDHEWYSILVHPPHSSSSFEFISYSKPSMAHFDSMEWITEDIPRSTFQSMTPWSRIDGANIVPLRISRGTSDLDAVYEFYVNVLGANLLFNDDNTMFVTLPNSEIEIQFVQRSVSGNPLEFGSFDVAKYEALLMETHESIMTSPFCGQSRWMDNHFGYSTWTQPGLSDVIHSNLKQHDALYHVTKSDTEHVSEHTRFALDAIGYEGPYTHQLWIIDPTGYSIQIGGILSDDGVDIRAPQASPQWCSKQCLFGEVAGTVDLGKLYEYDNYIGDNGTIVTVGGRLSVERLFYPQELRQAISHENEKKYIMLTIIGLICATMLIGASCYWYRSCREPSYMTLNFEDIYGYRMPSRTEAMDLKFFMA